MKSKEFGHPGGAARTPCTPPKSATGLRTITELRVTTICNNSSVLLRRKRRFGSFAKYMVGSSFYHPLSEQRLCFHRHLSAPPWGWGCGRGVTRGWLGGVAGGVMGVVGCVCGAGVWQWAGGVTRGVCDQGCA